ncbi:hypothetical protein [Candidatus Amarobacter glycogenicus]|uniref:hypothetical protein n=1 Tax=Candidatus Amarobacter glycogenicus TaxID=3140699 RepID=UPI002A1354D2|nr:hypothetical protein [Dehalococcoidia bacterium]
MDESWDMVRGGDNENPPVFSPDAERCSTPAFADASFSSIVGTLLFCGVPEPYGLRELRVRVKPEGHFSCSCFRTR